jgi:hypothetical protein
LTNDDLIFRFRLRLFSLAEEMGHVRAACRAMGVHHSTYYRWRKPYLTYGTDALRPRERRLPRMPNHTPSFIEQRILAFALAYPGFGPKRVAAELARERWGGIRISPNGVWRGSAPSWAGHQKSSSRPGGRLRCPTRAGAA